MLMLCIMMMAQTIQTDSVLRTLQEELKYSMEQLKQKPVPAYFMSLRMNDEQTVLIASTFGAAQTSDGHQRYIVPIIRIGDKDLDNYKYENQGIQNPNNRSAQGYNVAYKGGPLRQYRDEIWNALMERYDIAVKRYEEAKAKSKTDADYEDKAPCFSDAPVETYYEPELPEWKIDTTAWKNKLNRVTMVFKECRLLEQGMARIDFENSRKYIVNSDGSSVVQNRRCMRIMLSAQIKATDGMPCPLYTDFFGYSEDEMPSEAELIAAAKDLTQRLLALREAPLADPYTGPAILSGSASGVFFHEIFGHRLESHRMKKGGQTFKHMIGEKVLPTTFNVYCDPTLKYYGKQPLNGYYKFDEEGTKAQRVLNVENGILKNFLVGRIPIDGFPQSNGHARANGGNDPVSRQSNLIIETSKPYTDAQLREMLIKEAKKQGKEYGYFFRTVTSGFTLTDYLNAFNVDPVEVYRIFVDGRKDELVRGVNLIGTPLSMFSNIEAAGDKAETFTGSCGAESGWVPVTGTSPYIFVSKIETQRSNVQKTVPRALPLPEYTKDHNINKVSGDDEQKVIFKAMEDEMQRTKDSLQFDRMPLPFFVDYRFIRGTVARVSASLGGVYRCVTAPIQSVGIVDMKLGDYNVTSQLQPYNRGRAFSIGQEIDYDLARRCFWESSDEAYKICLNHIGQKRNTLKTNPLPEDDQNIPEMLQMEGREYIEPTALTELPDTAMMKATTAALTAIIAEYPQIYDTDAHYNYDLKDIYRVTSEGHKLRFAHPEATLKIDGHVKTPEGADLYDQINFAAKKLSDMPSIDELKQRTREFCELLIKKAAAPVIKEYYVGPLLLEDEAVNEAIVRNVVKNSCRADRDMYKGSSTSSMKLGKRIVDTKISIHQLTDTPEYNGVKLASNYKVDVDGVTPQKDLTIVEKGILKTLLTGRRPAIGAMQSTGNERLDAGSPFSSNLPGIIHVTVEKAVPVSKIKDTFIKEAKKAGLDHAFIVKAPKDGWRYLVRLDLKTGKEEIVRTSDIPQPSRGDLMHIIAASKEEFVANKIDTNLGACISAITPKAIIVENIEYTFTKPDRVQDFQLMNPAQKEKSNK